MILFTPPHDEVGDVNVVCTSCIKAELSVERELSSDRHRKA